VPWAHYPDTKLQEHVSNRNGGKEIQRGREGKGREQLHYCLLLALFLCWYVLLKQRQKMTKQQVLSIDEVYETKRKGVKKKGRRGLHHRLIQSALLLGTVVLTTGERSGFLTFRNLAS